MSIELKVNLKSRVFFSFCEKEELGENDWLLWRQRVAPGWQREQFVMMKPGFYILVKA